MKVLDRDKKRKIRTEWRERKKEYEELVREKEHDRMRVTEYE